MKIPLIWKDICTLMFFIVLFIISKIQKQPKWPLANECIKKVWHTYMVQYYSVMKKDETLSSAPTDGPWWYYAKWNQSDDER